MLLDCSWAKKVLFAEFSVETKSHVGFLAVCMDIKKKIKGAKYNIYPWHHLHYQRLVQANRCWWYFYPLPLEMCHFALCPISNDIPFRNCIGFRPTLRPVHLCLAIPLVVASPKKRVSFWNGICNSMTVNCVSVYSNVWQWCNHSSTTHTTEHVLLMCALIFPTFARKLFSVQTVLIPNRNDRISHKHTHTQKLSLKLNEIAHGSGETAVPSVIIS